MELTITDTDQGMSYWLGRPYLNETTRSLMAGKDVLIVPEEDFRPYSTPLFPSNLMPLYDELKKHLAVEAAINDEDYHELALNARVHKYGKFVVVGIVVPVFLNILSNFIYDQLKHEDPKDEIQLEIIIQTGHGVSKSIKYKGSADNFNKVAEKANEIANEDTTNEHRAATTHAAQQAKK